MAPGILPGLCREVPVFLCTRMHTFIGFAGVVFLCLCPCPVPVSVCLCLSLPLFVRCAGVVFKASRVYSALAVLMFTVLLFVGSMLPSEA